MGNLNMHDKHLKVNKSGGSSISPIPISSSISTFPALSKMKGNGGGVTSKQIKNFDGAWDNDRRDDGNESSKQKADNGIKYAA